MPRSNPAEGPAVRRETKRESRARHPLLKIGTPHLAVWDTLVNGGNRKGGATAAQMASACGQYHPQVLADLKKAGLVMETGKRLGRSKLYVADPKGRGIIPQAIQVTVEVYETESGAFVTRTYLVGRQDEPGKPMYYLGERTINIDIPPRFGEKVLKVADDIEVDPDYDPYEVAKAKRNRRDANVIIDTEFVEVSPVDHPARLGGDSGFRKYNPNEDDGCIIDQK